MDSEQITPTGHSTENLTELGKCLLNHEVGISEYLNGSLTHSFNYCFRLYPEHLHDPLDPLLHLTLMEGHHQLSPHCIHGLLGSAATGSVFFIACGGEALHYDNCVYNVLFM